MKSSTGRWNRHRRAHPKSFAQPFEPLESRVLLSFSFGGITIPGIPSIPGGITLPSFTNSLNLGALNSFLNPDPNDYWWLKNTGQTLSDPTAGPATGTPGADIAAMDAWNITTGNSNVVVAVLDMGIDLANSDLSSVLWTNPGEIPGDGIDNDGDGLVDDVHGWNFLNNSNDVTDNFVHGTAVAAALHSVAPGVTILPVEIGTASGVNSQDVIDGINYLINLKQHGVNIVAINASYISFTPPSTGEVSAIKAAGDNGMLYVAAAGNGGMNLDSLIPNIPAQFAKYIPQFMPQNLIFVAATDNQDNLASFSDYGANTVAVGAPGVDITLPIPGGLYAPLSGTSFAAPMVSGIAALLKSRFPNATMSQIKSAILNSGDPDPALVGKTITGRRVDALKAINYLMGNQLPTGAVETVNNSVVEGWAFEPNLGAAGATVQLSIDGVITATATANITRDDLTGTLGSADHGFSFDVSALGYGKHTVKVFVLDNVTAKQTLIGTGTIIVDGAPMGELESAANKVVTGWAADADTPTKSIQVKLFLDGKAWLVTTANINRPDVQELTDDFGSTTHGFSFKLNAMPAGIHRVDAYAVDSLTGALMLLGSSTVASNRAPTGLVETLDGSMLSGWAFDADAGAAAIQIRYQIDDFAPVFVTANLSRPDLQAMLGSRNHGFNIPLPQLTAGDHTITVEAVDPNSKLLVQLAQETITVADPDGDPLPTGSVTLSLAQVIGTVSDVNASGPINVRVDIDGKAGTPFASAVSVSDTESTTYGFAYTLPLLSSAAHRIDVYAIDPFSGAAVLIDRELINHGMPVGAVESLTSQAITGYAIAPPPSAKQLAQIRVDIDGLAGVLVNANLPRPDLAATLGSLNTGFNIAMPKVAPGDHTVNVYLIDPVTLDPILLSSEPLTAV